MIKVSDTPLKFLIYFDAMKKIFYYIGFFLRHPAWTGVGSIFAILSVVIAIYVIPSNQSSEKYLTTEVLFYYSPENRNDAERIAIMKLKRKLSEMIKVKIKSESVVNKNELSKDLIHSESEETLKNIKIEIKEKNDKFIRIEGKVKIN